MSLSMPSTISQIPSSCLHISFQCSSRLNISTTISLTCSTFRHLLQRRCCRNLSISSRQMDDGQHVIPEVSDNYPVTTDIVDGFERKSFELLEYINGLEAKLERQRCNFKQRQKQLEEEKDSVAQKLEICLHRAQLENARLQQDHDNFVEEAERTIQSLRKDVDATDSSLRKETRRVQDLEKTLTDLKQQLFQKQQSYSYHKATHEKEIDRLEEHVNMLRKRLSLGWILGRLTEVYLRMEPLHQAVGGSAGVEGTASKTVNMERIEKEVRCLIDSEVQSPRTNNASIPARPGIMSSDDEGSDSEKDDEFERRIRNLRSLRRRKSESPLSRDVGKQRPSIVEMEGSPSRARQSCNELGHNNCVQAHTQITTETEMRRRGREQINDGQPVTGNASPTRRSTKSANSKSPSRAIQKRMISSESTSRSPKKDLKFINESSAAVYSNSSLKDISRCPRDIQRLISNMKSKTKITSSSTKFVGDA